MPDGLGSPEKGERHAERTLSENAGILLAYLAHRGATACIAKPDNSRGTHYVLPTPTWNWDGRVSLRSVEHPECIQELVDYGYLELRQYPVSNWHSDYSTRWMNAENEVYVLTEEGRRAGAEILAKYNSH